MEQMCLFDLESMQEEVNVTKKLTVVKSSFLGEEKLSWKSLFEGFDELYAITFSSGLKFADDLIDMFDYAEIVFGCEDVVGSGFAAVMAVEKELIYQISKSKSVNKLSERMDAGSLHLYVSRDIKSHEKVFCLKSNDGRFRVITGSANMSASAFCGFQRENITYYDDEKAYEWYKKRFEDFKSICSDNINQSAVVASSEDAEYLDDHPEEIPVLKTMEKKGVVFLEPNTQSDDDEEIIVANIKGHENEMKQMIPKPKKDGGRLAFLAKDIQVIKQKNKDYREEKKAKEKKLPKLHLDYESGRLVFNGKECDINPPHDKITSDIHYMMNYLSSLETFYGDVQEAQNEYYAFLNWYFSTTFMPYLRLAASRNNYDVTMFPVYGIMYGESNGGKSTFVRLLVKMMSNKRIQMNPSGDFTASELEKLKRACEGVPINFDDLDKTQFKNNSGKIIKDDEWGIREGFINYPAVAITTNMIPSLEAPISKRAIGCRIHVKIDKESGVKNAKQLNESMKHVTNSMFCEYVRRMLPKVLEMEDNMKKNSSDYFPDIFELSSMVLMDIIKEYSDNGIPSYVRKLTYSDYFGEKVVGRNAIQKIIVAWENEPKQFTIDKKKNKLTYTYPDGANMYELRYINDELPPQLNSKVNSRSIVMDLDAAKAFFEIEFKKNKFFG